MTVDHNIVFALRISRVRRSVLEYLVGIYPNKTYMSLISKATNIGINEVYGALNGVRGRYKKENSLTSLNLVERERKKFLSLLHHVLRH